jgi:hypothetical protein
MHLVFLGHNPRPSCAIVGIVLHLKPGVSPFPAFSSRPAPNLQNILCYFFRLCCRLIHNQKTCASQSCFHLRCTLSWCDSFDDRDSIHYIHAFDSCYTGCTNPVCCLYCLIFFGMLDESKQPKLNASLVCYILLCWNRCVCVRQLMPIGKVPPKKYISLLIQFLGIVSI